MSGPLKKIKLKIVCGVDDFPEDTDRIVRVMNERGFECPRDMALAIWKHESEASCAGWLGLPKSDDDLFAYLRAWFEVDE